MTAAQTELIDQMARLAGAMRCRHRALSEHFGQAYEPESCAACDVCLGETAVEGDSARLGQILMSGVARTGSRFGAGHVADVLRGAATEAVVARGHEQLSVFGLLAGRTRREIMSLLDQLVAADALAVGEHRTLGFGPNGKAVMSGRTPVALAVPMGAKGVKGERKRKREGTADALGPEERALFERLRAVRKRLAESRGVPPYMVFSDATLRDMARERPGTQAALLEIRGVGGRKMEMFGREFLEAIAD